jgi:hypothetical protein
MDRRIREIEQSNDPLNAPEYHPDLSRFRATRLMEHLTSF